MKLNIKKINQELERLGWTRTEYAKQLKISKQLLTYHLRHYVKSISVVEKLAKPLNIDPKDLLI
jgi:ribosome-binding protein aMBF1 (putative translation factor)